MAESRPTSRSGAQIRDQYLAVAHLARVIAKVHEQLAPVAESLPAGVCGPRSAELLETLGDICNAMDVVEASDDWIGPILQKAHEMYPEVFNAPRSEKPAQLRAMQQCSRHQGIPITLKVGYAPAVATYCPNCEEEDAARR